MLFRSDVYTRAEQPSNAALQEDLRGFEELSFFFPLLFLTAAAMAGVALPAPSTTRREHCWRS